MPTTTTVAVQTAPAPLPLLQGGQFVFFLFVMIIVIIINVVQRQRRNEAWGRVAKRRRFRFAAGRRGTLKGEINGHPVVVHEVKRGSGKHRHTNTRIKLTLSSPLPVDLELTKEGIFSGIGKLFGSQDIEVGDPGFDGSVTVKGRDVPAIRSFLTPDRRLHCRRFLTSGIRSRISRTSVETEVRGVITSDARLESLIDKVGRMAGHLVGEHESVLAEAVTAQDQGDLERALGLVRVAEEGHVAPDPDAKRMEGELLYTAGRFDEAAEAFAAGQAIDLNDEELEAWHEHASAMVAGASSPQTADDGPPPIPETPDEAGAQDRPTSPEKQPEPSAAQGAEPEPAPLAADPGPVVETAAATDSSMDTICDALFSSDISSLRVAKHFEQNFQGMEITWTGELERVSSAAFDMVFGSTRFTKATVKLKEMDAGFTSSVIRAVLQLPEELEDELRGRTGQPLTFSGRLVRCDAFMRNLFVADATVT